MKIETDPAWLLEIELDVVAAGEEDCEYPAHGKVPSLHAGPGEWFLRTECPECGDVVVKLSCEKFKNMVQGFRRMLCTGCGESVPNPVRVMGRR